MTIQSKSKQSAKRGTSWAQMALIVLLILAAKSSLANWNYVPSGSMEPNLLVGDMIWVNHLAYDLRVPFTLTRISHFSNPQRGDIVVAYSPTDETRIVKRVVAVPGDELALYGQTLTINGQPTEFGPAAEIDWADAPGALLNSGHLHQLAHEAVLGHERTVIFNHHRLSSLPKRRKLAEDEYFLLGDHRDDSYDSRYWGPIKRERIIGQATHVVGSLDYQDSKRLRTERFLKRLN